MDQGSILYVTVRALEIGSRLLSPTEIPNGQSLTSQRVTLY